LPKLISECGDFLLFGFVSESVGTLLLAGLLMRLLCLLVSLIGVFEALSGAFMPGQVIFFSVMLGAAAMSVGSKVMMLSGDLLRFMHTIAGARVVPSVAPGQTKAGPRGLVRKLPSEVQDLPGACRFHGLTAPRL
jgi:hypothetical protein